MWLPPGLARKVPLEAAAPFYGASVAGFPGSLATVLDVAGNRLTGAALSVDITLSGPTAGTFALRVTEAVVGGVFELTAWTMMPA